MHQPRLKCFSSKTRHEATVYPDRLTKYQADGIINSLKDKKNTNNIFVNQVYIHEYSFTALISMYTTSLKYVNDLPYTF